MNNSLHNGNGSNAGYDGVNPLNTSFNNRANNAEQKITRGVILLSDTELEFHQKHGFRDQLFFVDERNRKVYAFRRTEIHGVIESVHQDGNIFFIEFKKGMKPCYWPVEKGCSIWPQANLEEAYQEFKEAFEVDIHINSFKGMLRRSFPNDYEKFLRRESELNSVLYDEHGKLQKTTSFDFDNTPSQDGMYPRLFFAHNGKVFPFKGVSILGIAAVAKGIRGEMEADGKHFSTTFKIVIPSDVKHFTIFPVTNERLWPQHSLQSAYEDFKCADEKANKRDEAILSFDEFSTFLSECYPAHYERIVTIQDQVSEYVNKTGRQPQIVTINTYKFNRNEPHSDISITAPDGQKWIISHEAEVGTEIEGVCKVIYVKRRESTKSEDCSHEIIVEDGVEAHAKIYGKGAKYPNHYFANGDVYKEGSAFEFKSSTFTSTKLKKIPLKGGISNAQKDSEQDNKNPEDETNQDRILSAEEAIKKLTLGQ